MFAQSEQQRMLGLQLAWVWVVLAALGLWLFGRVPGKLGWSQLMVLYPLVLWLGLAVYQNRSSIARDLLPLSLAGLAFASYQMLTGLDLLPKLVFGLNFAQFSVLGMSVLSGLLWWVSGEPSLRASAWLASLLGMVGLLEGGSLGLQIGSILLLVVSGSYLLHTHLHALNPIYAPAGVALLATLGSIAFSEIFLFVPCILCWLQRIAMYSLAFFLGVAALKQERSYLLYGILNAVLGIGVATLHLMEERIPGFAPLRSCVADVSCTTPWINWFGFITIPALSFIALALIIGLSIVALRKMPINSTNETE